MDDTTLQILFFVPAIVFALIGVLWYLSFPKKKRKDHDGEMFGLIALGIVVSVMLWSAWLIYDIEGTDEVKLAFANKVILSVILGTFGTLSAIAVLFLKDAMDKKRKKKSRRNKKK